MSSSYEETRALFSGFRRSRLWVVIGLFRSMLFISFRGPELWVTINFLGTYCYFPVIKMVNFVFYHFTSDLIPSSSPVFIVKYILFFSFLFIDRPRSSEVDSRYSYHTNDYRIRWLSEPPWFLKGISHLVVLLHQILSLMHQRIKLNLELQPIEFDSRNVKGAKCLLQLTGIENFLLSKRIFLHKELSSVGIKGIRCHRYATYYLNIS